MDLQKDKKVLHLERKKDFIIAQIKEPIDFSPLYNPKIIHLKPVVINEQGLNFWNIGSWDRKELVKFVRTVKKTHQGELLKIEEKKITNFSVITMRPELTEKQQKAMELAIKNGYYEYPRKIELKKLAKLRGLSYSTYQAHLRKAEKKLLPFFFERTK